MGEPLAHFFTRGSPLLLAYSTSSLFFFLCTILPSGEALGFILCLLTLLKAKILPLAKAIPKKIVHFSVLTPIASVLWRGEVDPEANTS